jgi:hypothetical protein
MHDFVVNIDGIAEDLQRPVQALDSHVDPGAEPSGIGQDNFHPQFPPGADILATGSVRAKRFLKATSPPGPQVAMPISLQVF